MSKYLFGELQPHIWFKVKAKVKVEVEVEDELGKNTVVHIPDAPCSGVVDLQATLCVFMKILWLIMK